MKRAKPMSRNTPLRSDPAKAMKRTPIKKVSAKKRQEKSATDKHRAAYVANAECCEHCERKHLELDCHEIAAGSSRHRSVYLANTWLAVCRKCHIAVQQMPIKAQYSIKCEAVARDINRALGRREIA